MTSPQLAHEGTIDSPHWAQKREESGFSVEQFGQSMTKSVFAPGDQR
jgi:hypothetical protein